MDKLRLIDVGARDGIDPRWAPYHKKLEVLAFEPDPKECELLNSKNYQYSIKFVQAALGSRDDKDETLFICRQPGCSSLLRPNKELCDLYPYGKAMEVVDEVTLKLNRMDTVCGDFQPDVLKIDTQGTELDILRGARDILDEVLAVELEVEFVPQYRDQALFPDIDIFMRQQGFTLRGLRRTYWRRKANHAHAFGGQLVHGDALYFRTDRMNSPKGHIILSAYSQYDLLAAYGALDLIPKRSWIVKIASKIASRYSNQDLRRFMDKLRSANAEDWHEPDFF